MCFVTCRRQGCQEGPCRGQRGHGEDARGRDRPYRHPRQGQGVLGCRGPPGGAGSAGLLLPSPPSMGAGHRREHQWPSQGLVPEGREPRRCQRQRGAGGIRFTQPETTQASQVEVPLGGLPPPVAALALRIRHEKQRFLVQQDHQTIWRGAGAEGGRNLQRYWLQVS